MIYPSFVRSCEIDDFYAFDGKIGKYILSNNMKTGFQAFKCSNLTKRAVYQ